MAERMLLVISLSLLVHFRSLIAYCCVGRRGSMSDVHSGGHDDGDGGVVDRRVEGVRTTWEDV